MSPVSADLSAKKLITLVEFRYGNPVKYARYTDTNVDTSTPEGFYLARPTMEINLPENTIGTGEKTLSIDMPIEPGDTFAELIGSGRVHSPVVVRVMELLRGPGAPNQINTLFRSRMSATTLNPSGRQELVRFEAIHPKGRLTKKLGFQCNAQCENPWGDPNSCGFDLSTVEESGTLTIEEGFEVTITGLAVAPRANYWTRGWIEYDDLRMSIRLWDQLNPTKFKLYRRPPANWDSASVTVTPGCARTLEACREWNNELNFLGLGIAMLPYNPLVEHSE